MGRVIEFDRTDDGIRIVDGVRGVEYTLDLDGASELTPRSPDRFSSPVDAVVEVTTGSLSFPTKGSVYLRSDGELVESFEVGGGGTVPAGSYEFEVETSPVKLYFAVSGTGVRVRHHGEGTDVAFDGETQLLVGVRSYHDVPAGTITTPDDPESIMRAISLFGSAVKSWSPERSFPTLRGHPPLLELGEEFSVSDGIERPETGVRIEMPPEFAPVYSSSTLAYYLGAELVPTDRDHPVLDAADVRVRLGGDDGSAADADVVVPGSTSEAIAETLRHLFLLGCVVRTEGLYQVELHQRELVADRLRSAGHAFDPATLYDLPLDERTARYLRYPIGSVTDLYDWYHSADVAPWAEYAEHLPYLVDDFSEIHSPPRLPEGSGSTESEIDDYLERMESARADETAESESSTLYRGAAPANLPDHPEMPGEVSIEPLSREIERPERFESGREVLSPIPTDTQAHSWLAPHYPMGSAKPMLESYERRTDTQWTDSTIDVTVVCNDERMVEETEDVYGYRNLLTFDVNVGRDLTVAELRETLRSETDFLHYVGHVTEEGMYCSDGYLDLKTVETVGVESFFLNACRSYEQGEELVHAGARGGIVTTEEVYDKTAAEHGRLLAGLLNVGFTLFGALYVVQQELGSSVQYMILGDGNHAVSPCSGVPTLILVEDSDRDCHYYVRLQTFATPEWSIGTIWRRPALEQRTQFLAPGASSKWLLHSEDIDLAFGNERDPMFYQDEVYWTNIVDIMNLL